MKFDFKKRMVYIVPSGLHSGHLNKTSHYSESDKNYIINTIRRFLSVNL